MAGGSEGVAHNLEKQANSADNSSQLRVRVSVSECGCFQALVPV